MDKLKPYLLHSRLNVYKKRVDKAKGIINRALDTHKGNWIISYSAGKDSTVLLHLLYSCGWRGEGYHAYYSPYEIPDENLEMIKNVNHKYGIHVTSVKCFGAYDAWKAVGHFYCSPQTPEEREYAKLACEDFKTKSLEFMAEKQAIGGFIGLRKEESKGRTMNFALRGNLYEVKSRGWTCCPISEFTGDDVWAYIASNQLDYLNVYDCPHFDRRRIRNELTVMYSSAVIANGMFTQYRITYPELYHKLRQEFPEISKYT